MNGSNAVRVEESPTSETQYGEFTLVQHSAIIYPWKSAPGSLASAMQRAYSFRYRFLKRTLDVSLSLILLIIFLPLGLALALVVALSSPGPVFYCEERVGRFRVPFRIFKFRSMYTSRPPIKVLEISTAQRSYPGANRLGKRVHDERITPIGRILRRMSLDELPQLWNVFLGDMSLVGPRPIVEAERHLYGSYLPYYDLFCPGITGLWQVSGRSDVDYDRRVLFDKEYASKWSCLLDFTILARTIPAVITMRGAY
jgi:exopolysaccharide production protein ExoY